MPVEKELPLVTLTTDIGWSYASQMKATLLRGIPSLRIVDMTHEVPSHQVLEGAFLIRYCCVGFPAGSIHIGVVDPGVGGDRQPIIMQCKDGTILVGPDNGLLVPLAEHLGEPKTYRISREKVAPDAWVSPTFEGRDLFAPAAALMAKGTSPGELGEPTNYMPFHFPQPTFEGNMISAAVLHVDHFGNVITNLPTVDFIGKQVDFGEWVAIGTSTHHFRAPVVKTYEELPQGGLGVVGSSFGLVEVSVNKGRARDFLGLWPGSRFTIHKV